MFSSDRNLAPEPQFSAYMYVLRAAVLEIRMRLRQGEPMPPDQLHDLLDAVHNVPEFVSEYRSGGGWFVDDNIKAEFQSYDNRWGQAQSEELGGFRLLDKLEQAQALMKATGQFDKRIALNSL